MNTFTLNPNLPRAETGHATTDMQVGRFRLRLEIDRKIFGGITWSVNNPEEIRPGDNVPSEGVIRWAQESAEHLLHVIQQFIKYDHHLTVEEEIEANPEKYAKIAETELRKEEELLAKAKKAEEDAAKKAEAEAAKIEQERLAALEAERLAKEQAEAEQLRAEHKEKLALRIRQAAAREISTR